MLPEASVTPEETKYRSKFYTGIKSVANKDLFCTSCGNTISFEADTYYSHPFLETLQCQPCFDKFRHLKASLGVEAWKKSCLMCGSAKCQTLFPCPVKNCPYSFCKNCIKRNAVSALIHADTKNWKCFVCLTNPLWEARGVCATLLSASPRRRNKEKLVREMSSDDDDIEDIKARLKSQKSQKKSKPVRQTLLKTAVRTPSTKMSRHRSKASVDGEDSDDDIEVIPTTRSKKNKKPSRARRRTSSGGSSTEGSEFSDISVIKRKTSSSTQPGKKKTSDLDALSSQKSSFALKRVNSDSSSGKEFTQTKLIKESFVPLQKLSLSEPNATNCQDETDSSDITLSKQDTSSLKNQMQDLINLLKSTSKRLGEAAESLQKQCPKKDKMKARDAKKLMVECKNTVSKFKKKIKQHEKTMVSNLGSWCKKSKVKNVFANIDIADDSDAVAISDCDSDEAFTQRDTAKNAEASKKRKEDKVLSPVHEEVASNSDGDNTRPQSALAKNSRSSRNSVEENKKNKEKQNGHESSKDIFDEESSLEENQIASRDQETSHLSDSGHISDEHSPPEVIEKPKGKKGKKNREKSPDHLELSDDETHSSKEKKNKPSRSRESSVEFQVSQDTEKNMSKDSENSSDEKGNQSDDNQSSNKTKDDNSNQSKKRSRKELSSDENTLNASKNRTKKVKMSEKEAKQLSEEDADSKKLKGSTKSKKNQVSSETVVLDEEEEAKKQLLDSDSTSEEESSDLLKDSQKETPKSRKEKDQGSNDSAVLDEEEEAKKKLLESDSTTEEESSGLLNASQEAPPSAVDTSEKNAEDALVNSDSSISEEDKTIDDSKKSKKDKKEKSSDETGNKENLEKNAVLESSSSGEFGDAEEEAKRFLLNSDASSKEDGASVKSKRTEKNAKNDGKDASSEAERKAMENLLNSDSSSEDERVTKTTDEPTKTKEKPGVSEVSDVEERAKQALLNSTSSSEDVGISSADLEEPAQNALVNSDLVSAAENEADKSKEKIDDNKESGDEKSKKGKQKKSSQSEKTPVEEEPEVKMDSKKKAFMTLSSPRSKREKLIFKNNSFYKSDKRLRMPCWVTLTRLSNRILRRHAKALKRSRDYLEDKSLKSLTSIDSLDKRRKRDCGGDNSDSSTVTSKSRNRKKAPKEAKDVLADHLNVNGDVEMEVDDATSDSEALNQSGKELNSLAKDNEEFAKQGLLDSSDDEKLEPAAESSDESVEKKSKTKKKKVKAKAESDGEAKEKASKSDKSDWRRSKLLTMKLSSSDSDEQAEKFEKKVEKLSQNVKNSDDSDVEIEKKGSNKKRARRRRLNSDSDIKLTDVESSESNANDSDKEETKKSEKKSNKKRGKAVDDSSDSSSTTKSRPKPKRRRVRTAGTDSDSDDDIEEIPNSQNSPNKPGRKNIRKVLKDKQVADDTKVAAKQEEERLKRMAERQKLYNEMYEARLAGEEKVDKLILDFDEETKEELLSVNEALVKRLKPHQAQGIKFMWDACFESLERATSTKGSGCILAHCMGLGKSFQVVTLTHTLLTNTEKTGVKTVLVVCPLSTVLNWVNEFKIWLSEVEDGDDIEVYELTKFKKNFERKYQLERWQKTGGVLIIGYEMYRNLSNSTKKLSKKLKESFFKCLVEPGPDLVVCDEGHLLKSESTAISKAMSRIRTLRRIVLTGTPLQNNLTEYHCMVQFVKPNLLGTKKEFLNRFVNPIQNGQFDDSTEYDVKIMKKRAHVLHKMLEGSVQRFDYSVLTPFLPPKQEYVIFLNLSDVQAKLYQYYIDNLARRHRAAGGSLFADFQALQRVWTHPLCIKFNADKVAERKLHEASDSEGSLKDFIDDGSDSDSSSKSDSSVISTGSSKKSENMPKRRTRANPDVEEEVVEEPAQGNTEWWAQFVEEDHFEDLRISAKLRILFEILKEAEHIGDKVLVFSQSLYSLTCIERFLGMIDDDTQKGITSDFIDGHTGSWSLGLDYFRLDGQSSTENRSQWCKIFNRPTNTRARLFLISTRAGGLGINLTAANRVIIFDASWNPSHDVQSIFRIYRFGQKKPCYVYRLLAAGTMEEKIYNRQVTKLSLSCRVVDEQQIERHYTNSDLAELYQFDRPEEGATKTIGCPKDRLLAEIFSKHKDIIANFHEHDSLLENKADEELDEEERKQAWLEYEQEKAGKPAYTFNPLQMNMDHHQMMPSYPQMPNPFANGTLMQSQLADLQRLYQKDFPNMTSEQQKIMATKALMDMYSYMENQTILGNRLLMGKPATNYPNPTNTLANQLAQEAYTKHHQQQKQMTAFQRQMAYAQQHGNFKTLASGTVKGPQPNSIQQRATVSNDPDIIEIIPSSATTTSNNSPAQSSTTQAKPTKNQEE